MTSRASDPRVARTRRTYDDVANSYRELHGEDHAPAAVIEWRDLFVDHVEPNGLVLDAGCGPGRDLRALRGAGLRAIGMDLSPRMAGLAPRPAFIGDLRWPPVRANSLVGVWCCASLLHVPREDTPLVFGAFAKMLQPSGTVALITALGEDEGWEVRPYAQRQHDPQTKMRRWFVYHPEDVLVELLRGAGFHVRAVAHRPSHRDWFHVLAQRCRDVGGP